jgi:zinc/manganese transport system substrate-binding protein
VSAVQLIEVPTKLDRALGDIHPLGNPHIQLDPRNVAAVAKALTARLTAVDPPGAETYAARGADFAKRWAEAIARWEAKAAALKGAPVVIMHRDQVYLLRWLGMKELAAIEPKPGVPPSAGHLGELVTRLSATPPRTILMNAYNDPKAAKWLSARVHAPVVTLPFSVGGTPGAKDLFGLFDDTIERLLGAAP